MMVAYIFVLLGIVRSGSRSPSIYFDVILYSAGGVVGTMHHRYFTGGPPSTWRWGRSSRRPR